MTRAAAHHGCKTTRLGVNGRQGQLTDVQLVAGLGWASVALARVVGDAGKVRECTPLAPSPPVLTPGSRLS